VSCREHAAFGCRGVLPEVKGKEKSMKRNLYVVVGALMLMLAAGAVFAQGNENEQVKAKIPFQFMVNDKPMPAGEYQFTFTDPTTEGSMTVRAVKGGSEEIFLVEPVKAPESGAKTELVFDEIGSHYFLRQIWMGGHDVGQQIAVTKAEKELEGKGHKKTENRVVAEHTMHKTSTSK
jgi:hypothetical protein